MKGLVYIPILAFILLGYCSKKSAGNTNILASNDPQQNTETGCPMGNYGNWESSSYVLPYPVGKSYEVNLSHCTNSYHAEGSPDQYGIDFAMPIGTPITATRNGIVVHIEESGMDGGFPNNLVVVKHDDETFAQYMHLTNNGALVEVGDTVVQGTQIGLSGATGLAGYPHLHFIVTQDTWPYPYDGVAINFKNTDPNPKSLKMGVSYLAYPY